MVKYFEKDVELYGVYKHKLKDKLEMKIGELNYNILNNILATGYMYKWKRTQNASCIYCNNDLHDSEHLLMDLHKPRKLV